ncbi:hypothetical protein AGR5A_Lc10048 [Agrobacterium genomosp. 5 str. CFBP 6626]|nr:hypothetical protein AGR5A_Lc10048 [Agrobacterium genomosp. 5 str. CFBP 6626]
MLNAFSAHPGQLSYRVKSDAVCIRCAGYMIRCRRDCRQFYRRKRPVPRLWKRMVEPGWHHVHGFSSER